MKATSLLRLAGSVLVLSGLVACQTPSKSARIPASGPEADLVQWTPATAPVVPPSLEASLAPKGVKGVNTDAVLVIKDGKILYESYRRGYDAEKKHLSWSMAKTFAGILVAQAIEDGAMGLDDPISSYFPSFATNARVRDVLQMSSGLEWDEEYSGIPVTSDAVKMLYLDGIRDRGMGAYASKRKARKDAVPGRHFYYSSGDTNLLMEGLRIRSGEQSTYDEIPFRRIFRPLGITDASFEQDLAGAFVGSSYVYLTLRDFARVGALLMNRGKAGSSRIIPEWYFKMMTEVAPGVNERALPGTSPTRAYSMQVTTNRPITGRKLPSEYADLPTDALLMIGHQGQLVIASPSQNLVIVRLAMDKGDVFPKTPFFKAIVETIRANGMTVVTARDERPTDYPPGAVAPRKTVPNAAGPGVGDYLKVPRLIRALAAKEYCSCMHLTGRSNLDCSSGKCVEDSKKTDWCEADLQATLPVMPRIRVDARSGEVRSTLGTGARGRHGVAEYRGPKLGCRLVTSE